MNKTKLFQVSFRPPRGSFVFYNYSKLAEYLIKETVFVPLGGLLFSMNEKAAFIAQLESGFRPPRGSFVFYDNGTSKCNHKTGSFRPPRGSFVFYSLRTISYRQSTKRFSSPSGVFCFLSESAMLKAMDSVVFVPLGGLLFSIGRKYMIGRSDRQCFRPPRGSFVFYSIETPQSRQHLKVFVPLGGLLFSI